MSRRRRHRTSAFALRASASALRATADEPADKPRDQGPRVEAPAVTIRIAQTDDDIVAIHRFMIGHAAAEMAEAKIDALIYMRTIHDTVREGAGLMAMIGGAIAGYLGLWKSQYDYSKAYFLHDRGFYVLPAHRGVAGAALLQEARAIAQEGELTLKIIDTNPNKQRRRAVTQILGFRPAGRVFTQIPGAGRAE
jgi:GNAT superfamily N-acetyltransferase